MGKVTCNVPIRVLTRENSKILNFMEKAPFQLKVEHTVSLDNLQTVFLNINLTNICWMLLLQKKKKTILKLLVKKMLKRVHQQMKEKELVTQSK